MIKITAMCQKCKELSKSDACPAANSAAPRIQIAQHVWNLCCAWHDHGLCWGCCLPSSWPQMLHLLPESRWVRSQSQKDFASQFNLGTCPNNAPSQQCLIPVNVAPWALSFLSPSFVCHVRPVRDIDDRGGRLANRMLGLPRMVPFLKQAHISITRPWTQTLSHNVATLFHVNSTWLGSFHHAIPCKSSKVRWPKEACWKCISWTSNDTAKGSEQLPSARSA